jgi:hypothetical protein
VAEVDVAQRLVRHHHVLRERRTRRRPPLLSICARRQ